MRKDMLFLVAIVGMAGPFAGEALARTFPISGVHSKAELKSKCTAAGGKFGEGSDGYACTTHNTGVSCTNNGICVGSAPRPASAGAGVSDVLGSSAAGTSSP
jgi:hypothetical protein